MKKFLVCVMLVGIVGGFASCTEEEAQKAADASFACLAVMLPAAQTCVAACIPTPVDEAGKLACEKTCVDQLVGNAGAMCGEQFGSEFKSEQFGIAVEALVKAAIGIYDATRVNRSLNVCPPCPCATSEGTPAVEGAPVVEGAETPKPEPVMVAPMDAPAEKANAVLPAPVVKS
jgi:hypothetical protein